MNNTVKFHVGDDLVLTLSYEGTQDLRIQLTVDQALSLGDELLTVAGRSIDKMKKADSN